MIFSRLEVQCSLVLFASGTPLGSLCRRYVGLLVLFRDKFILSQDLFYPFFLPGKFSLLLASIPAPVCTLAYAQVCQSVLTLICSLSLSPTLPPFPPPSLTFPSLLPFPACQCIASNEFFILDLICFHPHCSIFAYFVPLISLNLTFLRMISSSSYLPIFSALPLPSV